MLFRVSTSNGGICLIPALSEGVHYLLSREYITGRVCDLYFFISLNASKKPPANIRVINPAKYGIISIILFVV